MFVIPKLDTPTWPLGTLLEELGFPLPDDEWLQRNVEFPQTHQAQAAPKRRRLDGSQREAEETIAPWQQTED